MAERDASATLVLRKVRQVLDCFVPDNRPLTLTEIHQATGIPTTTALRLLRSLIDEGFILREDKGYRLGMGVVRYAMAVDRGLNVVSAAMPVIEELRDATGETASIVVRDGMMRVTVAVAASRQALARQTYVGEAVPLQAGSSSKILLAYDRDIAEAVLANGLTRFTPNTIVDRDAFAREIDQIRAQGFAVSDSEFSDMVASVSCPVFDNSDRVVAALCLGGPSGRFHAEKRLELVGQVSQAAARVSAALGWSGAHGERRWA